jgi:hypothetical protein
MPHIAELIEDTVDIEVVAAELKEYLADTAEYEMQCRYTWHVGSDDDEIDFDDPEVAEALAEYVSEHAQEKACEARDDLAYGLRTNEDGSLTLWRSIVVPHDWLDHGIEERPLGIYWAHDKSAAEPHWGSFGEGVREILLEGRVSIDDVNWQRTVCMNAQSEEEREISLKKTATVFLVSAEWLGPGPALEPVALGFEIAAGSVSEVPVVDGILAAA